jgi:hypothetical protein
VNLKQCPRIFRQMRHSEAYIAISFSFYPTKKAYENTRKPFGTQCGQNVNNRITRSREDVAQILRRNLGQRGRILVFRTPVRRHVLVFLLFRSWMTKG